MAVLHSLLWLFLVQPAPTGPSTVTASALVVQGRQAEARRKAIDKALRSAVLRHTAMLPGLRKARSRIFADFRNYVRSYRILEERFVGNGNAGQYRVTLQIRLDQAALSKLSDRLNGRRAVRPLCVRLTWNETPEEKSAGRHALVRLRAAGFDPDCRDSRRPTSIRLSCRIEAQGRVEATYGATVRCSLKSDRAGASVNASALAATPQQASARAHRLAADRATDLFVRRLEDAMACRRLRRIVLRGTVHPARLLGVARSILANLSQKTRAALHVSGDGVVVTLVTDRCNYNLMRLVSSVLSASGRHITATERGRDLHLVVTEGDTMDGRVSGPESSPGPAAR